MAGSKRRVPLGSHPVDVKDGTLCRAESHAPGPSGIGPFGEAKPLRRIRALAFDGAKTHAFLLRVALAESEWQELNANPRAVVASSRAPSQRDLERASDLYDGFLDACSRGPNHATAYLAEQHRLYRKHLEQSLSLLQSLQRGYARDEVLFSKLELAAQATKNIATAGVAIIGLFLTGPAVVTGAGIAFGFDVSIELVKRLEPSNESNSDLVVVGFRQTLFNDAVSARGSLRQAGAEATERILQKTLKYPKKSSIYRSAFAEAAHLDNLLKALSGLSAAVTIYTEGSELWRSYRRLKKDDNSY